VPDGIRLTGFIGIVGKTNYPVTPGVFGIRYRLGGKTFVGTFRDGLPGLVLSSDRYLWIDLPAQYDENDADKGKPSDALEVAMANCTLILLGDPEVGSDETISKRDASMDEKDAKEEKEKEEREKEEKDGKDN
jgi:hypothetical protein